MRQLFIAIGISLCFTACKENDEKINNQGVSYLQQGNYKEAIKKFSSVINNNSKLQLPYYNRGLCYLALHEYYRALTDFNKIISLQGADALNNNYESDTSLTEEEALAQVPYNDALYERAKILYHLDSVKNSIRDFSQLVSANYQKSNCYLWLGILWIKSGDNIKACEMFHHAKLNALTEEEEKEAEVFINDNCD